MGDTPFQAELFRGLVTAGVVVGLASAWRRRSGAGDASPHVFGWSAAAAMVLALGATGLLPRELPLGITLVATGGWVAERAATVGRAATALGVTLWVAGGGVVAVAAPGAAWVGLLVAVFVPLAATSIGAFDRTHPEDTPWLFPITVAGAYATLPDTEAPLVVLGASAALASVVWPLRWGGVRWTGAAVYAAALAWAAARGGVGRDGAVVGALAGVGILAVEPAARRLLATIVPGRRRDIPRPVPRAALLPALAVVHVATVLVTSRVAGLREGAGEAALIAAAALAGAFLACVGLSVAAGLPGARSRA